MVRTHLAQMYGNEFLVFVGTDMWRNYFEYTSAYLKTHNRFRKTAAAAATGKTLLPAPTSSAPTLFWREVRVSIPSLRFNSSVSLEGQKLEWKLLQLPALIQEATRFLSGLHLLLYEIRLHCMVGGLKWLRLLSIMHL